ncbi:MAG: hypothetical protein ACRECV_19545 [Xanthobacteraceae bacterium]
MRSPSLIPCSSRGATGSRLPARTLSALPAIRLPSAIAPAASYLACFFAGALLGNSIPHIVQGTSGNRFQTPLAAPPAVGESNPAVNVLWGYSNLLVGLAVLHSAEPEAPSRKLGAHLAVLLGAVTAALWLSSHFSKVRALAPHP